MVTSKHGSYTNLGNLIKILALVCLAFFPGQSASAGVLPLPQPTPPPAPVPRTEVLIVNCHSAGNGHMADQTAGIQASCYA